jgi:hypothetical protein
MTQGEAKTPTASAGKERKDAGEPRKAAGEEPNDGGIMQRISRLPIPGAGMAGAMPTSTQGRVLWWGGLAALAALDIVEWPVAVIVGAGEWVAEQYAKSAAQKPRTEPWQAASQAPSHS